MTLSSRIYWDISSAQPWSATPTGMWIVHLLFLVLLTELSQKEKKAQDGAQLWINISQNQGILE